MKFTKIYLSVIFFLSLLGLTGCTYEKYDVKFLDSSYNRFDYKGEHYGVTNQLISYEDIESKVSNHDDTYEIKNDLLEIGDLYQTKNREFAIKIDSTFYKCRLLDNISKEELLKVSDLFNVHLVGGFAINEQEARELKIGEQSFTITEEIVPKEELSATVANLDNQVKSVTRLSGEHESWKYGEICSLENQSIHEKVAVKLNGEYHLAFLRS
ncbi:NisI/SpaI family lantibiotic immunity lipoprotein [Streptococcus mitis]|jgi:hypothetical protein|uniref:Lipoprotein n=1 Tax=Streptococcus mitis TaxID=28037 RepID=A0A0F2DYZ1_STRMT|nr:NisI/SpaI family lantibiotic immunity lipoprotein [Streptococcus mitis]KJQ74751.1 lipoprotein [Streptococcus mitis]